MAVLQAVSAALGRALLVQGVFRPLMRDQFAASVPAIYVDRLDRLDSPARNLPGLRDPGRQRSHKAQHFTDAGRFETGLSVLIQNDEAVLARRRDDLPNIAVPNLWRGYSHPLRAVVAHAQDCIVATPRRNRQPSSHHCHIAGMEPPSTTRRHGSMWHRNSSSMLGSCGPLLVHNGSTVSTLFCEIFDLSASDKHELSLFIAECSSPDCCPTATQHADARACQLTSDTRCEWWSRLINCQAPSSVARFVDVQRRVVVRINWQHPSDFTKRFNLVARPTVWKPSVNTGPSKPSRDALIDPTKKFVNGGALPVE